MLVCAPRCPNVIADDEEHASRMLEEMSVSGGGRSSGGGASAFGSTGGATGAAASGGGAGGAGFNNTQGSTGSNPLSPPLSPMYSSPKGVSPRTNILPSFAWGKTMLKHLKRRQPAGSAGLRSHGAGMRAGGVGAASGRGGGAGGGVGNSGGGGGSAGGGAWGSGPGAEGDGGFVYPAGMVQVGVLVRLQWSTVPSVCQEHASVILALFPVCRELVTVNDGACWLLLVLVRMQSGSLYKITLLPFLEVERINRRWHIVVNGMLMGDGTLQRCIRRMR